MQTQPEKKQRILKLHGEIDHHSAEALRKKLDKLILDEKPDRLILDFREVRLMDSSGIGLILGRYKKLKKTGAELCVSNLNSHIDKVFRLAGLYQIIKKVK